MLRALNWISLGYAARHTTHNIYSNIKETPVSKVPSASLEGPGRSRSLRLFSGVRRSVYSQCCNLMR